MKVFIVSGGLENYTRRDGERDGCNQDDDSGLLKEGSCFHRD
jgi:hypothetical protein